MVVIVIAYAVGVDVSKIGMVLCGLAPVEGLGGGIVILPLPFFIFLILLLSSKNGTTVKSQIRH